MSKAELSELLGILAARQMSATLALFSALIVALERRGAISRDEVVAVLRDAVPHLDEPTSLIMLNRAIDGLERGDRSRQ